MQVSVRPKILHENEGSFVAQKGARAGRGRKCTFGTRTSPTAVRASGINTERRPAAGYGFYARYDAGVCVGLVVVAPPAGHWRCDAYTVIRGMTPFNKRPVREIAAIDRTVDVVAENTLEPPLDRCVHHRGPRIFCKLPSTIGASRACDE